MKLFAAIKYDKVCIYLLLLVSLTIPLKIGLNNIAVILLALFGIIYFFKNQVIAEELDLKLLILFSANYLILLFGMIYTSDVEDGLNLMFRKSTLLIVPFAIVVFSKASARYVNIVLLTFVAINLIVSMTTLTVMIIYYIKGEPFFDYDTVVSFTGIHNTYFAMYISFCCIILFNFFKKKYLASYIHSNYYVVLIIYFTTMIILLSSRIVIISNFIILIILFLHELLQRKNKIKSVILLMVCLVIAIAIIGIAPQTRERFKEFSSFDIGTRTDSKSYTGVSIRIVKWKCSIDVIKENWLFGVGTGDSQDALNDSYRKNGFWGHVFSYNAHNEYLQAFIRNGIIGFLIFVLGLAIPFFLALKRKSIMYASFVLLFALTSLTESTLSRQKGIIFYAFFNSFLAFNCLRKKELNNDDFTII